MPHVRRAHRPRLDRLLPERRVLRQVQQDRKEPSPDRQQPELPVLRDRRAHRPRVDRLPEPHVRRECLAAWAA